MSKDRPMTRSRNGTAIDGYRRQFLKTAALGGVALGGAGLLAAKAPAAEGTELSSLIPPQLLVQGKPRASPPYGKPSEFERNVVRLANDRTPTTFSSWSFRPLQVLPASIPENGLFYERNHNGVPAINPDHHGILIHGLVERPLLFSMDDLMKFPSISRIYFLECSGNSSSEFTKPSADIRWSHGLLSCAEWTGVPLAALLQEAGIRPEGKWILAEGADAAAMTRSIPIEKAMDDALIAFAQNGERLRAEQGYPVRLLLPGYEGNMSVKWLRRLKVGNAPFMTREETSKYTGLLPDGHSSQFNFVMEAKSVITRPAAGGTISGGPGLLQISGLAWSGGGKIKQGDVTVDGGRTWHPAGSAVPILSKALTRFRMPWRWDGSPAIIASRVTDESGYVQPTRKALLAARGPQFHYHYNAIAPWKIDAGGKVTNVYAAGA